MKPLRGGSGSDRRALPQVEPSAVGLGRPTIMERALAAQFGIRYVHLSVLAIDVDRVFMETDDESTLDFGWEVMLCLGYILGALDAHDATTRSLLEDSAHHILGFAPGDAPLGSQLAFAVYVGARAQVLDPALLSGFHSWKKRPKQLELAAESFLSAPEPKLATYALHCLGKRLTTPLAPPSLAALQSMAEGQFPLGNRWEPPPE